MQADEVEALVRSQIEGFRYTAPSSGTIGVPWSVQRAAAEVEHLRASLIRPHLATVEIADHGSPGPRRELWLVTRKLENGYLVVFADLFRAEGVECHRRGEDQRAREEGGELRTDAGTTRGAA